MSKFNEIFLAYLVLISGLSISGVAVYYSVVGLTAIFSTAVVPVIIMGVTLEIGKLVATLWLKQNWNIAPKTIKVYLISAIIVLMLITSMGIFGFLSKAHSDQNLVGGEVLGQLAIYDEKIKTTKENIETKRRELKQMDEAVDQVMARSQDEQGADKSIALRKSQQRDRTRISSEIEAEQKRLSELNNEAAPIRAQVRKVEAEVGPLKYIAGFVYGETDQTVLEKSVVWVIILLIIVFDPLAIVLLLASQITLTNKKNDNILPEPEPKPVDKGNKIPEKEIVKIIEPEPIQQVSKVSEIVPDFENTAVTENTNLESVDPWSSEITRKKVNLNKFRTGGDFLIDYYVNMVKSGSIKIDHVPEDCKSRVKTRLNEK